MRTWMGTSVVFLEMNWACINIRKAEKSSNSTHLGVFNNLDDLDDLEADLDVGLGAIVRAKTDVKMREGSVEKGPASDPL